MSQGKPHDITTGVQRGIIVHVPIRAIGIGICNTVYWPAAAETERARASLREFLPPAVLLGTLVPRSPENREAFRDLFSTAETTFRTSLSPFSSPADFRVPRVNTSLARDGCVTRILAARFRALRMFWLYNTS